MKKEVIANLLASFFYFISLEFMYKYQIVKLAYVKQITVLSSATIYRLIAKGEFPKQIKLSERSSGWLLDEIHAWLDKKINAREDKDKEYANGSK